MDAQRGWGALMGVGSPGGSAWRMLDQVGKLRPGEEPRKLGIEADLPLVSSCPSILVTEALV